MLAVVAQLLVASSSVGSPSASRVKALAVLGDETLLAEVASNMNLVSAVTAAHG